MARVRAALLLSLLALSALVAGCTSQDAPDEPSTDAGPQPPADGAASTPPEDAQAPPATQEDDLSWALGTHGCAEPPQAWEQLAQAFPPELDGVSYESMAIDPATHGGDYNVTFGLAPGTFAVSVVFWHGAVGPDGAIVDVNGARYTMALGSIAIAGGVPRDADFVTVSSCGPVGSAAHYFAEKARETLALLG